VKTGGILGGGANPGRRGGYELLIRVVSRLRLSTFELQIEL
jgi:hypothetical protein